MRRTALQLNVRIHTLLLLLLLFLLLLLLLLLNNALRSFNAYNNLKTSYTEDVIDMTAHPSFSDIFEKQKGFRLQQIKNTESQ